MPNNLEAEALDERQIKHMVERFLTWPLPADFQPDGGIAFEPVGNAGTAHEYQRDPSGTNLLDFQQAVEMVRHMTEGLPSALTPTAPGVQEADEFDIQDWYWRDMDPDDSGVSPDEAIEFLPDFCVAMIRSSTSGPTRFAFRANVLDPNSDETEVLHFATEEEAVKAAAERRKALRAISGEGE